MKSGLGDRNNAVAGSTGRLRNPAVSMKSGLGDRNNAVAGSTGRLRNPAVSMKSGLGDRNNLSGICSRWSSRSVSSQ